MGGGGGWAWPGLHLQEFSHLQMRLYTKMLWRSVFQHHTLRFAKCQVGNQPADVTVAMATLKKASRVDEAKTCPRL